MSNPFQSIRDVWSREGSLSTVLKLVRYVLPAPYERLVPLVLDELTEPAPPVTHAERMRLYRRGFRRRAEYLYDFEQHSHAEYLSDVARYVRAPYINELWASTLDNKLLCQQLLESFDVDVPTAYGLLHEGTFHPLEAEAIPEITIDYNGGTDDTDGIDPSSASMDGPDWITSWLEPGQRLVAKGVMGGAGKQVLLVERAGDTFLINEKPHSERELRSRISSLRNYLVTGFVEQAPYASSLYPDSANTLRVLTMYDEAAESSFVAAATHRIGTDESRPLDNFSRGGLSVGVDRESGTLGRGIRYTPPDLPEEHPVHPDTGETIDGVEVPGWERIERNLLAVANRLSFIPYLGWDIVVTAPGEFSVIEINNNSDAVIQMHGPLLTDARTRRFYERHGVVSARRN